MAELTLEQQQARARARARARAKKQQQAPEPGRMVGFTAGDDVSFGPSGFFDAIAETAKGVGETALSLGTGAAAMIPAGFSGLLSLGEGVDAAAEAVRQTQEKYTYQPRSMVGESATETISLPFQGAEVAATELGALAPEPASQTAVKTALLTAPALFGRLTAGREPVTRQQRIFDESRQEGYVAPTSSVNPESYSRSLTEGIVGKPRLAQESAFRNQQVTNELAARSLGLPAGTEITVDVLASLRREAGRAYDVLENAGTITATTSFRRDLSNAVKDLKQASKDFEVLAREDSPVANAIAMAEGLNKQTFDSGSVVAATRILRDLADEAYSNQQGGVANAYRAMSKALEDAAELHLEKFGDPAAVQAFRDARQQIAKSYSVQDALHGEGYVSAPKLAAQSGRGAPLSGELDTIAKFAESFPKAAAVIKEKPIQTGRLMSLLGLASSGGMLYAGSPAAATGLMAATFGAPLVRSALLSKPGQRLLASPRQALAEPGRAVSGTTVSGLLAAEEDEEQRQ